MYAFNPKYFSSGDLSVHVINDNKISMFWNRKYIIHHSVIIPNKVIKRIRCSYYQIFIFTTDDEIYVLNCGSNYIDSPEATLFDKTLIGNKSIKDIYCNVNSIIYVTTENHIYLSGPLKRNFIYSDKTIERFPCDDLNIKDVQLCDSNFIILDTKGKIHFYGIGNGYFDSEPDLESYGLVNSGIKKISYSGTHLGLITSDGKVYILGGNLYGQLGINIAANYCYTPYLLKLLGDEKIIDIKCAQDYTFCFTDKSNIYVCGANYQYQLGLGDDTNRYKLTKLDFRNERVRFVSCNIINISCLTETSDGYKFYVWGEGNTNYPYSGKIPKTISLESIGIMRLEPIKWCKENHKLYPRHIRDVVKTLMILNLVDENTGKSKYLTDLPVLPKDMVISILEYIDF